MIFGFRDIIAKQKCYGERVFPQALKIFTSLCVGHREFPLTLGGKKNMIFTGVGRNMVALHWILQFYPFLRRIGFHQITETGVYRFYPISKVHNHYANTEVNTQEIRLDPLPNEDLSKHCLKDRRSFTEQLSKK